MISRSGVHLPDTTYGGNPIHWNCADDLNGEPRNLQAENAKLRKLARQMYPYAKAHLQLGVTLGCNDTLSYDWALQMIEMGIEVPE